MFENRGYGTVGIAFAKALVAAVVIFNPATVFAGSIMGQVLCGETSKPISSAIVECQGRRVRTDNSGKYLLNRVDQGNLIVKVSANGYTSWMGSPVMSSDKVEVNASLWPARGRVDWQGLRSHLHDNTGSKSAFEKASLSKNSSSVDIKKYRNNVMKDDHEGKDKKEKKSFLSKFNPLSFFGRKKNRKSEEEDNHSDEDTRVEVSAFESSSDNQDMAIENEKTEKEYKPMFPTSSSIPLISQLEQEKLNETAPAQQTSAVLEDYGFSKSTEAIMQALKSPSSTLSASTGSYKNSSEQYKKSADSFNKAESNKTVNSKMSKKTSTLNRLTTTDKRVKYINPIKSQVSKYAEAVKNLKPSNRSWKSADVADPALMLFTQGQYDDAAVEISLRLNDLMPSELHRSEYLYMKAWIALNDGHTGHAYDAVIESIAALKADAACFSGIDHLRSMAEAYRVLGEIHAADNILKRAESAWNVSLDLCPDMPDQEKASISLNLARLAMARDEYTRVLNIASSYSRSDISDEFKSEFLTLSADVHYQNRDLKTAAATYREALGHNSRNRKAESRLNLCEGMITYASHAAEGHIQRIVDESLPKMARAVQIDPEDPEVLFSLGYIEYLLGRGENMPDLLQSSIGLFDRISSLDPSFKGNGSLSPQELSYKARSILASVKE